MQCTSVTICLIYLPCGHNTRDSIYIVSNKKFALKKKNSANRLSGNIKKIYNLLRSSNTFTFVLSVVKKL